MNRTDELSTSSIFDSLKWAVNVCSTSYPSLLSDGWRTVDNSQLCRRFRMGGGRIPVTNSHDAFERVTASYIIIIVIAHGWYTFASFREHC